MRLCALAVAAGHLSGENMRKYELEHPPVQRRVWCCKIVGAILSYTKQFLGCRVLCHEFRELDILFLPFLVASATDLSKAFIPVANSARSAVNRLIPSLASSIATSESEMARSRFFLWLSKEPN